MTFYTQKATFSETVTTFVSFQRKMFLNNTIKFFYKNIEKLEFKTVLRKL